MAKQVNASPDSKLLLIHHRGLVLLLPMAMQPPGKCDSIADDDVQCVSATHWPSGGKVLTRWWPVYNGCMLRQAEIYTNRI